jgi:hypothetical protein
MLVVVRSLWCPFCPLRPAEPAEAHWPRWYSYRKLCVPTKTRVPLWSGTGILDFSAWSERIPGGRMRVPFAEPRSIRKTRQPSR